MGRVSRYKKVKSIDPFAKNGSWKSDVGDCATLRRGKKKSKTALKLKEQKRSKLQRRGKKGGGRGGGGSNGFGDEEGYDLPPAGGDEFDLADLTGSVKRQRPKGNPLLDATSAALPTVASASAQHRSGGRPEGDKKAAAKKKQKGAAKAASKAKAKYDGTSNTNITHKTPTSEIIAAHAEGRSKKGVQGNGDAMSAVYGASKQEKRRAFLENKKKGGKKRKRGSEADDDDDGDGYHATQQALQSLHSHSTSSTGQSKPVKQPKKHLVKQQNYSDTMIARTAMDDPAERPPTFTSLPRGAHTLAKNKKAKRSNGGDKLAEEGDDEKQKRIQKEQREMEAMRNRVMMQYAALRESRRSGGR